MCLLTKCYQGTKKGTINRWIALNLKGTELHDMFSFVFVPSSRSQVENSNSSLKASYYIVFSAVMQKIILIVFILVYFFSHALCIFKGLLLLK